MAAVDTIRQFVINTLKTFYAKLKEKELTPLTLSARPENITEGTDTEFVTYFGVTPKELLDRGWGQFLDGTESHVYQIAGKYPTELADDVFLVDFGNIVVDGEYDSTNDTWDIVNITNRTPVSTIPETGSTTNLTTVGAIRNYVSAQKSYIGTTETQSSPAAQAVTGLISTTYGTTAGDKCTEIYDSTNKCLKFVFE